MVGFVTLTLALSQRERENGSAPVTHLLERTESVKPYFDSMEGFGKALKPGRVKRAAASADELRAVEAGIAAAVSDVEKCFRNQQNLERWIPTVLPLETLSLPCLVT